MAKVFLFCALAWTLCPQATFAGPTLVFNMEDGHVLYADDPDVPWYPASLTKMMTAYVTYEAIRNGRATMDTRVYISPAARKQPPFLSNTAPVIVAPAMNTRMWANPAVQANIDLLKSRGVGIVPPVAGELACGDAGEGKLAELKDIFTAIAEQVNAAPAPGQSMNTGAQPLSGRRIVVTAGGTREYLDPVRFITNASTGRLALEAADKLMSSGAEVVLVDSGIEVADGFARRLAGRHEARTAFDMLSVLSRELEQADGLVMLAAVADYSPSRYQNTKRKKDGKAWKVEFSETTDVLAEVAARRRNGQLLVGVSLEDTDWVERAVKKTAKKHVDAILAVELGGDLPFGDSRINCALVDGNGVLEPAAMRSKPEAAGLVAGYLAQHLGPGRAE